MSWESNRSDQQFTNMTWRCGDFWLRLLGPSGMSELGKSQPEIKNIVPLAVATLSVLPKTIHTLYEFGIGGRIKRQIEVQLPPAKSCLGCNRSTCSGWVAFWHCMWQNLWSFSSPLQVSSEKRQDYLQWTCSSSLADCKSIIIYNALLCFYCSF
jgi:hypothetical protein